MEIPKEIEEAINDEFVKEMEKMLEEGTLPSFTIKQVDG
jgi:hypothetical protein